MTQPMRRARVFGAMAACLLGLAGLPAPAPAFDFSGEKALLASTPDRARIRIGTVRFLPLASSADAKFEIRLDTSVMTDHFLSMREFKCLPGGTEISCFVPYPHAHPGVVSAGKLAWLEHNLLFLYKRPTDFGAKLWNGVIFKFTEQGQALVGHPQAIDLNRISAPPDSATEPPYGPGERDDFPPSTRWLQELRIE